MRHLADARVATGPDTRPMTHPNAEIARRGYAAFATSDTDTLLNLLADDITWHVGGDGPLSGSYVGIHEVTNLLGQVFNLTGGTQRLDVHDVFATDDHIVAVLRETATRARDGAHLDVREAHIMRLDAAGKVVEFWDLPDDPGSHDAFFS